MIDLLYINAHDSSTTTVQAKSGDMCQDSKWKVGPGHLDVKDLVLLSLERASYGTWVMSICVLIAE